MSLVMCCRGVTALHNAAWHGHKEVAQLLLEKDAHVNAADNHGLGLGISPSCEKGRWFGVNETGFSRFFTFVSILTIFGNTMQWIEATSHTKDNPPHDF